MLEEIGLQVTTLGPVPVNINANSGLGVLHQLAQVDCKSCHVQRKLSALLNFIRKQQEENEKVIELNDRNESITYMDDHVTTFSPSTSECIKG